VCSVSKPALEPKPTFLAWLWLRLFKNNIPVGFSTYNIPVLGMGDIVGAGAEIVDKLEPEPHEN
jgi:hypothetical protein